MSLLNNVLMGSQAAGMFGRGGMGRLGMGLGGGRGGISPMTLALLGTLAYRTMKGKGRLADMLGTSRNNANPQAPAGGTPADILSPAALSEGLSRLLNRFRLNGHGDVAQSWVEKGAIKPIEPPTLEEALGEERIEWLMEQTGLPRDELLDGLSKSLPKAVDELTPDGKIPSEQEAQRLM